VRWTGDEQADEFDIDEFEGAPEPTADPESAPEPVADDVPEEHHA
jgi:hypothetical protein